MSALPKLYTGFLLALMCAGLLVLAAMGVHQLVSFWNEDLNWYVSFASVLMLVGGIIFQVVTYMQISKK